MAAELPRKAHKRSLTLKGVAGAAISIAAPFALLAAAPALAAPGDMSVATFLAKADALLARGPLALFSGDAGLLRKEATAAGEAYKERLKLEQAAGKPSSCPPRGKAPDQDMWLAHLRSYPAAARPETSVRSAMADLYRKKWPCRG